MQKSRGDLAPSRAERPGAREAELRLRAQERRIQAAIANANSSAGDRRLKIKATIKAATMRAISNDSIGFVACKSSEQNTRSLDDTKTPKSGYPPASPISFTLRWATAICRAASAITYFFKLTEE